MESHSSIENKAHNTENSSLAYTLKDAFNNGLVEFTTFIEALPEPQRRKLLGMLQQNVN
jgi:hypothetical protein